MTLRIFLCILDVDPRCQLVDQLIALDNGVLNPGEWFVQQELKTYVGPVPVCDGRPDGARFRDALGVGKHRSLV